MRSNRNILSSFRDPDGFVFSMDDRIYRQVNTSYKDHYDHLLSSGLYKSLVTSELMIPHDEVSMDFAITNDAYKILQPKLIPFISYPFEWCFSQLKEAALITLEIQKRALNFNMTLKDSSAYNIQFVNNKPIFIDTLSFEKYKDGEPWNAYRQFCQHFLAPLALMSFKDIRLNKLSRIYIDGIPLDLASSLLPLRTWFKLSLFSHVHLHAKSQKYYAYKKINNEKHKIRKLAIISLIDNLISTIKKLKWRPEDTEWANYYEDTNYSSIALNHKKQIVAEFINEVNPKMVWDLGANTGMFSQITGTKGIYTISFDDDPGAVEINYLKCVDEKNTTILPLILDLTNPSPGIGWQNQERISIMDRGPVDVILSLALIHHLAISNNLSFNKITNFFHNICNSLIIEFVPKHDSQVQKLLSTRKDIFTNYKQEVFEQEFNRFFSLKRSVKIKESSRTLYLMHRR